MTQTNKTIFSRNTLIAILAAEMIAACILCAGILRISTGQIIGHTTDYIFSNVVLASAVQNPQLSIIAGKELIAEEERKIEEEKRRIEEEKRWKGPVLSKSKGVNYGPNGKETYYNLNMSGVVSIMRSMGNTDEYWVRDDGCKMLGDYIMVAANLNLHPRGSIVETSLGSGIVCDTGGFARKNPNQIDIATTW